MPAHELEVSWELVGEGGSRMGMGESTIFKYEDTVVTEHSAGQAKRRGKGKRANGPAEEGVGGEGGEEEEEEAGQDGNNGEASTTAVQLGHFRMPAIPLIVSKVQRTVTLKLSAKYRYATKDKRNKESAPEPKECVVWWEYVGICADHTIIFPLSPSASCGGNMWEYVQITPFYSLSRPSDTATVAAAPRTHASAHASTQHTRGTCTLVVTLRGNPAGTLP